MFLPNHALQTNNAPKMNSAREMGTVTEKELVYKSLKLVLKSIPQFAVAMERLIQTDATLIPAGSLSFMKENALVDVNPMVIVKKVISAIKMILVLERELVLLFQRFAQCTTLKLVVVMESPMDLLVQRMERVSLLATLELVSRIRI